MSLPILHAHFELLWGRHFIHKYYFMFTSFYPPFVSKDFFITSWGSLGNVYAKQWNSVDERDPSEQYWIAALARLMSWTVYLQLISFEKLWAVYERVEIEIHFRESINSNLGVFLHHRKQNKIIDAKSFISQISW